MVDSTQDWAASLQVLFCDLPVPLKAPLTTKSYWVESIVTIYRKMAGRQKETAKS